MLGVVGSGLSVTICQGVRLMDTPQWTMLAPQREHYNPTETNVFTTLLTLQEEKRSSPTATPDPSPITLTLNHLANKPQQTTHTLFGLMYQVRDGLLYLWISNRSHNRYMNRCECSTDDVTPHEPLWIPGSYALLHRLKSLDTPYLWVHVGHS